MDFNKNTRVKDILTAYPFLREKLPAIDDRFGIINTAVGKMFIRKATLEDLAFKAGTNTEDVIKELKKLIGE